LIGGSLKGKVLTFNSDTWGDDTCIAIVGESVDELGNVTYQLAGGYDVTRFNTINQVTGEIDILSRVDNEIFVFAAFNKYKFEFESGVETEDNPNKLDGVLYGMDKNSIQWAKKEVRDIDGNPYQYKIGDVKFAVLDEGTYSQLKEYVAEHHATIPTALETVMKANSSVKICSSLEDFMNSTEVDRTKNLYVIAFVYDIKSIQEIVNQDGTIRIEYNFDDSQTPATFKINIVSSNTLYFDATAEKINAWLETATNTKHNF